MSEMTLIEIVETTKSHFEQILSLNESAVPHVNSLSLQALEELSRQSKLFLVAADAEERIVGFILVLDETAKYSSPNYQFFKTKFESFLYIDRIVIDTSVHRNGIGRRLYQAVIDRLGFEYPRLTCEVNLQPPNPQSMRFHQGLGFAGLEEQETENGSKRVSLMVKDLT